MLIQPDLKYAVICAALALSAVGCATTPVPNEKIAVAQSSVQRAEQAPHALGVGEPRGRDVRRCLRAIVFDGGVEGHPHHLRPTTCIGGRNSSSWPERLCW